MCGIGTGGGYDNNNVKKISCFLTYLDKTKISICIIYVDYSDTSGKCQNIFGIYCNCLVNKYGYRIPLILAGVHFL